MMPLSFGSRKGNKIEWIVVHYPVAPGCNASWCKKYYERDNSRKWGETTDFDDLSTVVSESEFYFGMHPIYDNYTKKALATLLFDVLMALIPFGPVLQDIIDRLEALNKYAVFMLSVATNGLESTLTSTIIEEGLNATNLNWVNTIRGYCDQLDEIANSLSVNNSFYKDYIRYVAEAPTYKVVLKSGNTFVEITDINDAIN